MKAEYNITLRLKIVHEIDDWCFDPLKDGREMADSIGQMICDEAVSCGGIGAYDILKATMKLDGIIR